MKTMVSAVGVGMLALGAAFGGTSAATAATELAPTGSVQKGRITLDIANPILSVALDSDMKSQLLPLDPALGYAYFNGEASGGVVTALYVVAADGSILSNSSPEQTFGGTGAPADPFWIQTKRTGSGGYAVSKRDSYVLGSTFVQTDLTYENLSTKHSDVALNYFALCMRGETDSGLSEVVAGRASCKRDADGSYNSFTSRESDASFAAGDYIDVRTRAFAYAPLPNTCVPLDACTRAWDTSLAISFRVSADAGQRVTKTYYASYSAGRELATVVPDLAVSQSELSVGDEVTFSLSLANRGPGEATNANLVFRLPEGFELVGTSGDGTYDDATGLWSVGALSVGSTAYLQVKARASKAGQFQAGVSSTGSDVVNPAPCSSFGGANCGLVNTLTVAPVLDLQQSTLRVSPATVVADGSSSASVTIHLVDSTGSPFVGTGHTVQVSSTIGAVGAVTDNGDGSYSAGVTSAQLGSGTVTFSVDGVAAPVSERLAFVAGAVDPTRSTVTVSAGTRVADGVDTHTITATLADSSGNPVSGAEELLSGASSESLRDGVVSAFSEDPDAPGTYRATVTSTVEVVTTISVSHDGRALIASGNAQARFVGPAVVAPPRANDATPELLPGLALTGSDLVVPVAVGVLTILSGALSLLIAARIRRLRRGSQA